METKVIDHRKCVSQILSWGFVSFQAPFYFNIKRQNCEGPYEYFHIFIHMIIHTRTMTKYGNIKTHGVELTCLYLTALGTILN
jgi:hypothetical protein